MVTPSAVVSWKKVVCLPSGVGFTFLTMAVFGSRGLIIGHREPFCGGTIEVAGEAMFGPSGRLVKKNNCGYRGGRRG